MSQLYVIDTFAVISFFPVVFNTKSTLGKCARTIITRALNSNEENIKLSIPSIVFVEIFEKWLICEEISRMFFYEVFHQLIESPNIEIRSLDEEVIQTMSNLRGLLEHHDIHDKIILSSAIVLNSPLITNDPKIIDFIKKNPFIPIIEC